MNPININTWILSTLFSLHYSVSIFEEITCNKQKIELHEIRYFEIQLARDEGGSPSAPSQIGNISPAQFFPSNACTRLGTVALFFLSFFFFFFSLPLGPFSTSDKRLADGRTTRENDATYPHAIYQPPPHKGTPEPGALFGITMLIVRSMPRKMPAKWKKHREWVNRWVSETVFQTLFSPFFQRNFKIWNDCLIVV